LIRIVHWARNKEQNLEHIEHRKEGVLRA
jgi:hypothetical protein